MLNMHTHQESSKPSTIPLFSLPQCNPKNNVKIDETPIGDISPGRHFFLIENKNTTQKAKKGEKRKRKTRQKFNKQQMLSLNTTKKVGDHF